MSTFKTRGVEPIVAAILLIVVAVVGAILLYMWFSGYLGKTTGTIPTVAAVEKIKIDVVNCSKTNATVFIRNIGDVVVNLTTIYVYNTTDTFVCKFDPKLINPGEVSRVGCKEKLDLSSGKYYVKAVTAKGTEVETTCTVS